MATLGKGSVILGEKEFSDSIANNETEKTLTPINWAKKIYTFF